MEIDQPDPEDGLKKIENELRQITEPKFKIELMNKEELIIGE